MKSISDCTEAFESDTDCILRLLQEWPPSKAGLQEKEYEQELQSWLKQKLVDVPIVAQYGIAKGKADLVIEDAHVIELKLGFSDESLVEFDRCIGQMERYRQKWVNKDRGKVFLVVVGKSETEFRTMLHNAVEKLNQEYFIKRFFIIEKF